MPTRCRSATRSVPGAKTDMPSTRMSPSWRTPGIRSLSRLIERRNVDLPQPDGPMMAVTALPLDAEAQVPEHLPAAVPEAEVAHVDRGRAALAGLGAGGRGESVARGVGMNPGCGRWVAVVVIRTSR